MTMWLLKLIEWLKTLAEISHYISACCLFLYILGFIIIQAAPQDPLRWWSQHPSTSNKHSNLQTVAEGAAVDQQQFDKPSARRHKGKRRKISSNAPS